MRQLRPREERRRNLTDDLQIVVGELGWEPRLCGLLWPRTRELGN